MDFIPGPDPLFIEFAKRFKIYISANFAALGLSLLNSTALEAAFTLFNAKYTLYLEAQSALEAALQDKKSSKSPLEAMIREFSKIIQANPSVTNAQKAELGITVPKETRTPSPVPTTRPMAEVDNKQRLLHTVHFFDEGSKKGSAKPAGVRACEIWLKIGGAPPIDESEVKYLATDTKAPYNAHFEGVDGGKTAHYMLRWVNTRGEVGPWSETISVTISA